MDRLKRLAARCGFPVLRCGARLWTRDCDMIDFFRWEIESTF